MKYLTFFWFLSFLSTIGAVVASAFHSWDSFLGELLEWLLPGFAWSFGLSTFALAVWVFAKVLFYS